MKNHKAGSHRAAIDRIRATELDHETREASPETETPVAFTAESEAPEMPAPQPLFVSLGLLLGAV